SHVDARQPPDTLQKMPVGAGIVDGPVVVTVAAEAAAAENVTIDTRIAQPGTSPFGLLVPVVRERKVIVLDAGILLKRSLRVQDAPRPETDRNQHERHARPHNS